MTVFKEREERPTVNSLQEIADGFEAAGGSNGLTEHDLDQLTYKLVERCLSELKKDSGDQSTSQS